jgi:hypothetical protein
MQIASQKALVAELRIGSTVPAMLARHARTVDMALLWVKMPTQNIFKGKTF